MRTRNSRNKNRQGVAAVEFALVCPLLFLLILSMAELSRFFMGLHAVSGAAREACRVYAVRQDESAARQIARDYLANSLLSVSELDVEFTNSSSGVAGFQRVECDVRFQFREISLINDPFNWGANALQGHAAFFTEEE